MSTPAAVRIQREVGTGDGAIDKIVSHMERLARRDASTPLIQGIARQVRSKTELETVQKAFYFIADAMSYKRDPDSYEYVVAPIHSIPAGEGDCDCMSTALLSILIALQINTAIVVISWDRKRCNLFGCPFTHVYLLAQVEGYGWIPLDPVMGRDGFGREKAPIIRRKRYVTMQLVTLEDDVRPGTPCRRRKIPVQLNINNIINAGNNNGNGNGNSQQRDRSPETYTDSRQRNTANSTYRRVDEQPRRQQERPSPLPQPQPLPTPTAPAPPVVAAQPVAVEPKFKIREEVQRRPRREFI